MVGDKLRSPFFLHFQMRFPIYDDATILVLTHTDTVSDDKQRWELSTVNENYILDKSLQLVVMTITTTYYF